MDRFDCISPLDFRYHDEEVATYLSEDSFTRYKAIVEAALVCQHCGHNSEEAAAARLAATLISTEDVYEEEGKTKHDIRALVNVMARHVPDFVKPFLHQGATSYDIVDTANALRYRGAYTNVIVPRIRELILLLADIADREAATPQIGRTHGQHAVPITFGFAIAGYVSRIGNSMLRLEQLSQELPGKFSGAVGAYNATDLISASPVDFERELLAGLELEPADHATQIVQPEFLARLLGETILVAGGMANLADDMRNLQRSEIGEVGEAFGKDQVGSSTMPQKRNPIAFENVKSLWKEARARYSSVLDDLISEHQRDLTNSASGRFHAEIPALVAEMTKRLTGAMKKLRVDRDRMAKNLALTGDLVLAEALYIVLAMRGFPDGHEKVRSLTLQAEKDGTTLIALAESDPELALYWGEMNAHQRAILTGRAPYQGLAEERTHAITASWRQKLGK